MSEAHAHEPDPPSSDATSPAWFASIDVELVFSLGRVSISLHELHQLAQGQLIDLGRSTSCSVEILAQGQRIGLGELVEVDGRLAVEVLEHGPIR